MNIWTEGWPAIKKHEPEAYIENREEYPDVRKLEGPLFAVVVDKGFQAPRILGEGKSQEDAIQDALDKQLYIPPEPRKPSYEELETIIQTREHIDLVRLFLRRIVVELLKRGETHDRSKLDRAEVDMFTEYTGRLKGMTYGSDEYKQCLKEMGPALDHHYAHNRHHPEYFGRGLKGMNLIDLVELFVDWLASTKRHADGDIFKSIEINRKRFNMSDDLMEIFQNSVEVLDGYK